MVNLNLNNSRSESDRIGSEASSRLLTRTGSRKSKKVTGGTYTSRCNFSLLSNYILYIVFILQAVFFTYFAYISPEGATPCYANFKQKEVVSDN